MRKKIFALYKGDEFIDLGTIDELSQRRGIKVNTLRWYARPSYRKQRKRDNCYEVFAIEGEYEEKE